MKEEYLQFMNWNECTKEFVRVTEKDEERIKSIVRSALNRFEFVKSIKVDERNSSYVVENYYEVIKELLIALLLKNSLKSKNHQCLISYFYKNYPQYEFEANLILKMSYLRNRLDYYGELIELEFYTKHKNDFIKIVEIINNLIEINNPKQSTQS